LQVGVLLDLVVSRGVLGQPIDQAVRSNIQVSSPDRIRVRGGFGAPKRANYKAS
jgi:hypothetical protein